MGEHCYSCTAPLTDPQMTGASDIYCKWCSDENGNLKPRDEVREGIARWLERWQPRMTHETALARADRFMSALPAWAKD